MGTSIKNSAPTGLVIIGMILALTFSIIYYQFNFVPTRFTPVETGPIGESAEKSVVFMVEGAYLPNANLTFVPGDVVIVVGKNSSVVWSNVDSVAHTVTSEGGQPDPRFDKSASTSNFIQPGEDFAFTFTRPGVYQYFCVPHPWMRGTVTVVEGSSA